MSIDFEHSVEIERPGDEVFEFVANFENNPRWQGGMTSCRWTSEQPMVVGATYVQEARFLGRRMHTHFRVSALRPGQTISIQSTRSPFPIQVTRSVERLCDDRCRVTAHVRGQPTGLFAWLGGVVKRSVIKDYRRLKALLETG